MAPPSGSSSSAVTAGDMLTPMMALDLNDAPPTATKVTPSAAMVCLSGIYVLRRVRIGTIAELHLRKVGVLTLSGRVKIPTLHSLIQELSVRKVVIGTK